MKKSFTLAETLITLAIIGIVASITIPTTIKKYNEKQTIFRLTSAYSILANAFNRMIFENGRINTYGGDKTATNRKLKDLLPK